MEDTKQLTLMGNETPEQAEAIGLHYEIVSAAQAAASSLLDLGRKLKRMRDSGKYKALGFETFGDYTEQAVHIRQRQAYTYISVVEKLPAQLIEENAAAGVTKLALLAKLGPQDREEVAGDLANITVTELQKLIDEKNDMAEQLSLLSAPPAAEAEAHEVDVEAELKKAADQARAEAEAKAAADMEALREQHRKALEESEAKQEERLKAARREAEKAAAEKIRQAKRDAEVYAIRREAEAADKARKAAERAQKERDRAELEKAQQAASAALEAAFDFMEQAFAESQEMVVFVTELTVNPVSHAFLTENGCERYFQYNKDLLLDHRKAALQQELAAEQRRHGGV